MAANKSVLVVDAGVKPDAAEATKRGAKDWKRMLRNNNRIQRTSERLIPETLAL